MSDKVNDPLSDVFNQWYDQFGVQFYPTNTKDQHKEYMKYAFTHGILHGANAAQSLQHRISQKHRSKGRNIS